MMQQFRKRIYISRFGPEYSGMVLEERVIIFGFTFWAIVKLLGDYYEKRLAGFGT